MRVVIKVVALMLEQCRKYARKTRKKRGRDGGDEKREEEKRIRN